MYNPALKVGSHLADFLLTPPPPTLYKYCIVEMLNIFQETVKAAHTLHVHCMPNSFLYWRAVVVYCDLNKLLLMPIIVTKNKAFAVLLIGAKYSLR